jgi:signal transduction histidine kinase
VSQPDLARILAHELEPSLISLELRLRSLVGGACHREAESCLAEVEALRSLLHDFLLLGRREIQRRSFPLAPILLSLGRRFGPLAAARGISLEIAQSPVEAAGDSASTERALSNLIDNALKFSAEGTRVRVEVRESEETVAIEVEDRGEGIPTSQQERIFEPFARLDREKPGFGLGLSIARELAEAQGGRLSLSSAPGRGSSFVVTLPRT